MIMLYNLSKWVKAYVDSINEEEIEGARRHCYKNWN